MSNRSLKCCFMGFILVPAHRSGAERTQRDRHHAVSSSILSRRRVSPTSGGRLSLCSPPLLRLAPAWAECFQPAAAETLFCAQCRLTGGVQAHWGGLRRIDARLIFNIHGGSIVFVRHSFFSQSGLCARRRPIRSS